MATTWRKACVNAFRRRADRLAEWVSDHVFEALEDDYELDRDYWGED